MNDIHDDDNKIRADELAVRIVFGKDQDGTSQMQPWTRTLLFGTPQQQRLPLDLVPEPGPDYPKLLYPTHAPLYTEPALVANGSEFRCQFRALTLGLLDEALAQLPMVVARGGSDS